MYYLLCYLHQDIPGYLSANKWFYIIRWTFDRAFVKTRLYFYKLLDCTSTTNFCILTHG